MAEELMVVQMSKAEVERIATEILSITEDWWRKVAPLLKKVKAEKGYLSAGFKTLQEWCSSLDRRLADATQVRRVLERTEVEDNIGKKLPAQYAYALAKLPNAEAQIEVYTKVTSHFPKPQEINYVAYVEGWFADHQEEQQKRKQSERLEKSKGWTRADLEDDEELAGAFDRIEKVYGHQDRKTLQDGTVGLSRKDVIALSAFHASKMREVHYLIIHNRWDVARALRFVNDLPDGKTTVHELQNHCLATAGFYYTCSVEGFDIQIKACKALSGKIKG